MSLYNGLYGRNPLSAFYLAMLSLEAVPRLRDVWLSEDGSRIVVFARIGGGNREEYGPGIESLRTHPQYLEDSDDEFDSTYAHFAFMVPAAYLPATKLLSRLVKPPKSLQERFHSTMDEIKKMTPAELRSDPRFRPFVEVVDQIAEETKPK